MVKVLIRWLAGEQTYLYVVEMTQKQFNEIKQAHNNYLGQYPEPSEDEELALTKINLAFAHKEENGEFHNSNFEWADEFGINYGWIGRFSTVEPHTDGPLSVDHFIDTGYCA